MILQTFPVAHSIVPKCHVLKQVSCICLGKVARTEGGKKFRTYLAGILKRKGNHGKSTFFMAVRVKIKKERLTYCFEIVVVAHHKKSELFHQNVEGEEENKVVVKKLTFMVPYVAAYRKMGSP